MASKSRSLTYFGLSFSNVYMRPRVHDTDELRHCLLHVLHDRAESLTDDAVDQWPARLRDCVRANGGHFEHTL